MKSYEWRCEMCGAVNHEMDSTCQFCDVETEREEYDRQVYQSRVDAASDWARDKEFWHNLFDT